ncbi:MAG TPA: DUF488 family protein [Candidatus Angelobacter sp.]|nr:DUF488 family protein [Candidatus Angelobacter sp.]
METAIKPKKRLGGKVRSGGSLLIVFLPPKNPILGNLHLRHPTLVKSGIKDVAPSAELRKWFSHNPAKWDKFRSRHFDELKANPDAWQPVIDAAGHGTVTLIFTSHDTAHNNAVAQCDMFKASNIELHFPVKTCRCVIEIAAKLLR